MGKLNTGKGYIAIAAQANKGSAVTTPDIYLKYLEESFQSEHENSFEREGGDDELVVTGIKNLHREKFSFKVYARPDITAYLYSYILGADSVTGTGDPYTHVITRLAGGRLWLTIQRMIADNFILIYTDAKIESITCEMEAGKPATLSVEGSALTSLIDTTELSPSYESVLPFVMYNGEGAFKIDSTVDSDIKKVMVKIAVASQDGMQTDGLLLGDLQDLKLDIDVSIEKFADGTALYKKTVYNNETAPDSGIYDIGEVEFDLKLTETVADDREFKINVKKVLGQPVTGDNLKGEPEIMTEVFAGIGAKPDSGEIVTVTMKNSLSADLA